jgi:hypothetical protein
VSADRHGLPAGADVLPAGKHRVPAGPNAVSADADRMLGSRRRDAD